MSAADALGWSRGRAWLALTVGVFVGLAWSFHSRDALLDQDRDTRLLLARFESAVKAEQLRPMLLTQLEEMQHFRSNLALWLPSTWSDESLREALSAALTEHQISPTQLRLGDELKREFYAKRTVTMSFSATAEQLWPVLDALGNRAPMKSLQSLQVRPDESQPTALNVDLEWHVFRYLEESDSVSTQ